MSENRIVLHLTQMLFRKCNVVLHSVDIKMNLIPSVTQVEISMIIPLLSFHLIKDDVNC